MLGEWRGAPVDATEGKPTSREWEPVTVPGRPEAFAGEDRVAYRTVFRDPRDPDDAMALLELRGCYARAEVWLNDDRVAESDAYFEPIRVPFEPEPENELVVECRTPEDRFGGIHDTDRIPDGRAVPGIWWGADLTTHPSSFVIDVETRTEGDENLAAIHATVEVYASEPLEARVTLTTRPAGTREGRGVMDRAPLETAGGERATAEKRIELRDPSLWWPRGLGEQHRYAIRAKVENSVTTTETGLATVTRTGDGFAVNGRPVPVRGVTLQDGALEDVDRAVEVNANVVRAHAHVLPEAVYAACDEAGLLVWQDLPLTGPGPFDVERGKDLLARLAKRYGRHPSLATVGVHDEPTRTFTDRLGSGVLDRLRLRYRAWRTDYDRGPAEEVATSLPESYPVIVVVGEPGTDPDAAALYPGWDYGDPDDVEWLLDRYPHLTGVGEFGAGSLGEPESAEIAGFDRAKHDANVPADDVSASQAYQGEVLRRVAESLRSRGSGLVVANALRDAGDAGMGVYTREGDPKASADALATAFEPVGIFLTSTDRGETDVVVANDRPEPVAGTLTCEAGEESIEREVTVDPFDRTTVDGPALPGSGSVELVLATDDGDLRRTYDL